MINISIPVPTWVVFFLGCIAGYIVCMFVNKYNNRMEQIRQIKRIVEMSTPNKKGK
jgi:uncharacterized integral membrane protein